MANALWISAAVVVVAVMVWAWNEFERARCAAETEEERLRRLSADELARLVAERLARHEQWRRFAGVSAFVLRTSPWTDEALSQSLDSLRSEVCSEDGRLGRTGRDSNYFEWHDAGLVSIEEILAERVHTRVRAAATNSG